MKNLLLLTILFTCHLFCFGQAAECTNQEMNTEVEIKQAEACVLQAAEYALKIPIASGDDLAHSYRAFILKWMEKTSSFEFSLNKKIMAICEEGNNVLVFPIYCVCLAKAAIDKGKGFEKEAVKLLVTYVRDPNNKVELTKKVRSLIEDFDKGEIEKYY